MKYTNIFKMPYPVTIMARTSSITNSFVNGIIPCITPTEEEIEAILAVLGMDAENMHCVYCGGKHTEWDHFRPLIIGKKPTGYISEINNLVPACGKCNQSKGNRFWKEWMLSDAKLSPKSRNVPNLNLLICRLEEFERTTKPIKMDFESIVGDELWKAHWDNCARLHSIMRESQLLSNEIRNLVRQSVYNVPDTQLDISTGKNSYVEETRSPEKKVDRKVSEIVRNDFKALLEANQLPMHKILELQDLDYCKRTFGVGYAILKKVKSDIDINYQRKDKLGRSRYYTEQVTIFDEEYLLTSQWYERHKSRLMLFLEIHS